MKPSLALKLILLCNICYGQNLNYAILSWQTVIHNSVTDHRIPLKIHYPNSTNSNEKYPLMIFNHGGDTKNTWYNFVWQTLVPLDYIVVMLGDYEKYINDIHYAADQRYKDALHWMYDNCNVNV